MITDSQTRDHGLENRDHGLENRDHGLENRDHGLEIRDHGPRCTGAPGGGLVWTGRDAGQNRVVITTTLIRDHDSAPP